MDIDGPLTHFNQTWSTAILVAREWLCLVNHQERNDHTVIIPTTFFGNIQIPIAGCISPHNYASSFYVSEILGSTYRSLRWMCYSR